MIKREANGKNRPKSLDRLFLAHHQPLPSILSAIVAKSLFTIVDFQETFTHSTLLTGSPSVVLVQVTTLANGGRTATPTPCPS
jgi:hypothetical protein